MNMLNMLSNTCKTKVHENITVCSTCAAAARKLTGLLSEFAN